MKVCRVCLAMGVKMYHISEHNLNIMYEQISGLKINTDDELPKMLCWECVARLSSAHNFMKKALRAHLTLVEKIKSSRFITMDDLEFIDKTQFKSTLGVKLYKDNYSYIHVVKESDNCYEDSEAKFSEPNHIDINNVEEQKFAIQDIVGAEENPIKTEYSDVNEEQISEYENNIEAGISNESSEIKFENIEFKTEMLEINVTENRSDEEMVFNNESNNCGMFDEKNQIKVETIEVYEPVKQNRKRKRSESLPDCKEPRVVLEDVMLSLNEHNTQDNSQSTNDNNGTFFLGKSSISDPVSVRADSSDAVSSNKLLICDKFTCNYCTFETSVKRRLTYHTKTKHLKSPFNCAHCDFLTNCKSKLTEHVNAKHTKNIAFNCSYCSFNTHFKNNLVRHINSKHTKKDVFTCSFCNYETYNKNSLPRHVNAKHTKTKVFPCSYCSFISYQQINLNRHVNSKHTKNLSFDCSLCNYKTFNKDLLKAHINSNHTKTDVFKCSSCNFETYNKRCLKDHMNAKHTKVNTFACPYCSFKAYQKSSLNVHVNARHTKMKAFHCSFCNYKAYNKRSLKDHINANHTKVDVFICSYCNLRVYYKSTLIRHIKVKHS